MTIQWYDTDTRPHFASDDNTFSIDVLVYGYISIDNEPAEAPFESYGIGYLDGNNVWNIFTTNGNFPTQTETFTLLRWAYLSEVDVALPPNVEKMPV